MIETTNYRTVKLPTGMDVPLYVKDAFGDFYRAMFDQQVKKRGHEGGLRGIRLGHGLVRPVRGRTADARPSSQSLGVFWLGDAGDNGSAQPTRGGGSRRRVPVVPGSSYGGAQNVFVTRLHVRYDNAHFPEDLVFQETGDRTNFQGRYVLRHPWTGKGNCEAAKRYRQELAKRLRTDANTLAGLTGWDLSAIRAKMELPADGSDPAEGQDRKWYQKIWKN